jgi:RNA polymerase sigma-70 factor (ECF subfamily)
VPTKAALALKVICALPVSAITRLFAVSEATMVRRIICAKAKVCEAGIASELPPRRDRPRAAGCGATAL